MVAIAPFVVSSVIIITTFMVFSLLSSSGERRPDSIH